MTRASPELLAMVDYLEKNGPTHKTELLRIASKLVSPTCAIRERRRICKRKSAKQRPEHKVSIGHEVEMGTRAIVRRRLENANKYGIVKINEDGIVYLLRKPRSRGPAIPKQRNHIASEMDSP